MQTINISSKQREEFIDITESIKDIIDKSKVKEGLCIIYTPHTTSAITINENADEDVKTDIISYLSKLIPNSQGFRHLEGNSDAHIKSSLVGASETIIIENNKLVLGTWQGVYFCEFDGPRNRKVHIQILPTNL